MENEKLAVLKAKLEAIQNKEKKVQYNKDLLKDLEQEAAFEETKDFARRQELTFKIEELQMLLDEDKEVLETETQEMHEQVENEMKQCQTEIQEKQEKIASLQQKIEKLQKEEDEKQKYNSSLRSDLQQELDETKDFEKRAILRAKIDELNQEEKKQSKKSIIKRNENKMEKLAKEKESLESYYAELELISQEIEAPQMENKEIDKTSEEKQQEEMEKAEIEQANEGEPVSQEDEQNPKEIITPIEPQTHGKRKKNDPIKTEPSVINNGVKLESTSAFRKPKYAISGVGFKIGEDGKPTYYVNILSPEGQEIYCSNKGFENIQLVSPELALEIKNHDAIEEAEKYYDVGMAAILKEVDEKYGTEGLKAYKNMMKRKQIREKREIDIDYDLSNLYQKIADPEEKKKLNYMKKIAKANYHKELASYEKAPNIFQRFWKRITAKSLPTGQQEIIEPVVNSDISELSKELQVNLQDRLVNEAELNDVLGYPEADLRLATDQMIRAADDSKLDATLKTIATVAEKREAFKQKLEPDHYNQTTNQTQEEATQNVRKIMDNEKGTEEAR
ncbi:MAG: hypothetical protein IJ777_00425 [Clostridia bacterium]|nr:hypothetical protein [Clostridia bacterium]